MPESEEKSSTPKNQGASRLRWLLVAVVAIALVGVGGWFGLRAMLIPASDDNFKVEVEQPKAKYPSPVLSAFDIDVSKADHPLDPALEMAEKSQAAFREKVADYTARVWRVERHSGELYGQMIKVKVRHERINEEGEKTPFSVYVRFIEPESVEGREVIYVEGANNGNIIAHREGKFNLIRLSLEPDGWLAMIGNRYPLTMIGLDNMLGQMIVRGQREVKLDGCEVDFIPGVKLGDGEDERVCTLINIWHREKKPEFDFYLLKIFVDEELLIPVRYAAFTWPEEGSDEDFVLQEEYTYFDFMPNVGLTDEDFDPDNPDYEFP